MYMPIYDHLFVRKMCLQFLKRENEKTRREKDSKKKFIIWILFERKKEKKHKNIYGGKNERKNRDIKRDIKGEKNLRGIKNGVVVGEDGKDRIWEM